MAQVFKLKKPITTTTPTVDVVNDLKVGVHTFQLVVVDDDGNQSAAARARVVVREGTGPGPLVPNP
jgi:hypothetical protein